MNYNDFEWNLKNSIFTDSVFFTHQYDGARHIIIQSYGPMVIMITINKSEDKIRVSLPNEQIIFDSYEEVLHQFAKIAFKDKKGYKFMKTFILHWLDGTTETIHGNSISDAFAKAGYSAGSLAALDYYDEAK